MDTQALELKLQAYKESFEQKIASTVGEYEERIADLRVELTLMNHHLQEVLQRLAQMEGQDEEIKEDSAQE